MSKNNDISTPFGLPEGYFGRSKKSLFNKIEWLEEHKDYPFLEKLKEADPLGGFHLPSDYFNASVSELELSPFEKLSSISKESVFVVPDGYFELFAHVIGELLLNEEFVMLQSINKENPFSIPDNYFELKRSKLITINESSNGRIIQLFRKTVWYAAAAALVVTMGFWVYDAYFTPEMIIEDDCHTLACIDKQDLMKFKFESLDNEELFELVDANKLKERLNEKTNAQNTKVESSDSINDDLLDLIE